MARPPIDRLPAESQRVARAWEDAKRRNPQLTQADFSAAVFGGRKRAPGKPFGGPPETWQRRQREADARYLRLVLEGKRVPKKLVARADRGGVVNVGVRHGRGWSSFNIRLPRGVSKLDAFTLSEQNRFRQIVNEQARSWAKRYAEDLADFDTDEPNIRGVRRARRVLAYSP